MCSSPLFSLSHQQVQFERNGIDCILLRSHASVIIPFKFGGETAADAWIRTLISRFALCTYGAKPTETSVNKTRRFILGPRRHVALPCIPNPKACDGASVAGRRDDV
jgi:hypothetical protein